MMDRVALGQGFLQVFKFPPSLIVTLKFAFMHLLGLIELAVQKLLYKRLVSLHPKNKKDRFKQAAVNCTLHNSLLDSSVV
jgi:hypothetical protein